MTAHKTTLCSVEEVQTFLFLVANDKIQCVLEGDVAELMHSIAMTTR